MATGRRPRFSVLTSDRRPRPRPPAHVPGLGAGANVRRLGARRRRRRLHGHVGRPDARRGGHHGPAGARPAIALVAVVVAARRDALAASSGELITVLDPTGAFEPDASRRWTPCSPPGTSTLRTADRDVINADGGLRRAIVKPASRQSGCVPTTTSAGSSSLAAPSSTPPAAPRRLRRRPRLRLRAPHHGAGPWCRPRAAHPRATPTSHRAHPTLTARPPRRRPPGGGAPSTITVPAPESTLSSEPTRNEGCYRVVRRLRRATRSSASSYRHEAGAAGCGERLAATCMRPCAAWSSAPRTASWSRG